MAETFFTSILGRHEVGKLGRLQQLMETEGVYWVRVYQCAAGQTAPDADGERRPARKTTGFWTSVLGIAEALGQFVCPNRDASQPHLHHKHVELVDGKAASTAEYPQKLVYAVRHAFRQHLRENSTLAINDLEAGCHGHEEIDLALYENVVDESTGKTLPPALSWA